MWAINRCIKEKYAKASGRACRSEYWFFCLFCFLLEFVIAFVGGFLAGFLGSEAIAGLFDLLLFVVEIGLLCPSFGVAIRRLHDTNRSGWWLLIALIPLIGIIVLFIFLVSKGTSGDNRFGPDPLTE